MSTGFNPQQQQYQQYPMPQNVQYPQYQPVQQYTAAQNQAAPTASAVNIQIFNPTANAAPTQPVMPLYPTSSIYGYPGMTPSVSYPVNYNAPINQYNSMPQPQTAMYDNSGPVQAEKKSSETEETKKKDQKKKQKVILTDNYIKSLENYLNNEDAKIRLTAAKELLERFKEDDKRKADPALTALLNKVIQDPKASVRYVGLTTLDVGYAQGNEETVNILKQLENRPDLEYGEDSILASQILLKMSGQKVEVPDNSPPKKENKS